MRRFIESDVTKALYLEPTCINVLLVNPCVCRVFKPLLFETAKFVSVYGIDSTAQQFSVTGEKAKHSNRRTSAVLLRGFLIA